MVLHPRYRCAQTRTSGGGADVVKQVTGLWIVNNFYSSYLHHD